MCLPRGIYLGRCEGLESFFVEAKTQWVDSLTRPITTIVGVLIQGWLK